MQKPNIRIWEAAWKSNLAARLLTLLAATLMLWLGMRLAGPLIKQTEGQDAAAVKAVVVGIHSRETTMYDLGDGVEGEAVSLSFYARILSGEQEDALVIASQQTDPFYPINQKEAEVGDKVVLYQTGEPPYESNWQMGDYLRTDAIGVLFLVYVALLLLLGGFKGLWALLALGYTCAAVFVVFLPAVLAGKNAYFWSMAVCLYSIGCTLLLVSGASRKSLAAGIGCAAGVGVAGLLTLVMDKILMLTGYVNEESLYLSTLESGESIHLNAVLFAGILIGAMGAVMDVAMSIASALWELSRQKREMTAAALLRSGLAIGRDIMGTMANTLVLAYIGSSLSTVMLLIAYSTSLVGLLNREMIVVELLQALVGSMGILCAIPLTSMICGMLYRPEKKRPDAPPPEAA